MTKNSDSFQTFLQNRTSVSHRDMQGEAVALEDIKQAMKSAAAAPVHGKETPFHFIVFAQDSLAKGHDILYASKAEKMSRQDYDGFFGGVGAFIFIYCDTTVNRCPQYEDEWATACATYGLELALGAMGYSYKWHTIRQESTADTIVQTALGLESGRYRSLGYLSVGKADIQAKERPDIEDFCTFA